MAPGPRMTQSMERRNTGLVIVSKEPKSNSGDEQRTSTSYIYIGGEKPLALFISDILWIGVVRPYGGMM